MKNIGHLSRNNEQLILEGEAYCNFIKTLRSPHTKKTYISALTTFMKYKNLTGAGVQAVLEYETKRAKVEDRKKS